MKCSDTLSESQSQSGLPGVEAPPVSSAAFPLATVPTILFGLDVVVVDVVHQVLQRLEQQVALEDRGEKRATRQWVKITAMCVLCNCYLSSLALRGVVLY